MSDASRAASVPGAAHRDADVGVAQRGGVVDAVPGDRDDLAVVLEPLDKAQLVRRRDPGVDRVVGRIQLRARSRRRWRDGRR